MRMAPVAPVEEVLLLNRFATQAPPAELREQLRTLTDRLRLVNRPELHAVTSYRTAVSIINVEGRGRLPRLHPAAVGSGGLGQFRSVECSLPSPSRCAVEQVACHIAVRGRSRGRHRKR